MQKKGSKTIKRRRDVKTASSNARTSKNRSNLSNISSNNNTGDVLLDDIFSELDVKKRNRLLKLIANNI